MAEDDLLLHKIVLLDLKGLHFGLLDVGLFQVECFPNCLQNDIFILSNTEHTLKNVHTLGHGL